MSQYDILCRIWWGLSGVILWFFLITEGFDFGAGILLPFAAKGDTQRRQIINAVGPVWESNQVWLILGAGAMFAAWPPVYGALFSVLYVPVMITLAALILRPVAFKIRSKHDSLRWRYGWDTVLCLSSLTAVVSLALTLAAVVKGVPFYFDADRHMHGITGAMSFGLWEAGVVALLTGAAVMHGACYLRCKTHLNLTGYMNGGMAVMLAGAVIMAIALTGGFEHYYMQGTATPGADAALGTVKAAVAHTPELLSRFTGKPVMAGIWLGLFSLTGVRLFFKAMPKVSWVFSSLAHLSVLIVMGVWTYPYLLPSSSHPQHSLTIDNAASGALTLRIMLIAVLIFLPIILGYVLWTYRVMRGITDEQVY